MDPDILPFPSDPSRRRPAIPAEAPQASFDEECGPPDPLPLLDRLDLLIREDHVETTAPLRLWKDQSSADESREPPQTSLPPAWLLILALLPFWLIPLAHSISSPETSTGLFEYEVPYYLANGRAIWSRGNGLSYPNPYNPDPAHPNIYFHWLIWAFGSATVWLDADPGAVWFTFTWLGSLAMGIMTWRLTGLRIPASGPQKLMYFLACWGGGLLSLAGILTADSWLSSTITPGTGPNDLVSLFLSVDPGKGQWYLNWGRNATLATEAVYHAIVAAAWFTEIRGRRWGTTLFLVALATTHPWSGLELLLTVSVWRGYCWLRVVNQHTGRRFGNAEFLHASVSGGILVAFLSYYKLWLPSFTQHNLLQHAWQLEWTLPTSAALLAYGLVAIPAAVHLASRLKLEAILRLSVETEHGKPTRHNGETGLSATDGFLCCALVVACGLSFHDRLAPAVQPIHFTRGYIWMPLFLLGVPVISRWLQTLMRSGWRGRIALTAVLLMATFDNVTFSAASIQRQLNCRAGFHLDQEERVLLSFLNQRTRGEIALCDSESLNYLLPAYTDVRPWLGHHFNTPDYPIRLKQKQRVFLNASVHAGEIPAEVDVLAVRLATDQQELRHSVDWIALKTPCSEWQVWERVV
ncbi:MAG: hypothetical protein KDA85_07610, partial [Planctomycetaceae bacterium]|nr:hypothetical protein [Planctomycetaceae bacterium]